MGRRKKRNVVFKKYSRGKGGKKGGGEYFWW
jgi:hypothetical protein